MKKFALLSTLALIPFFNDLTPTVTPSPTPTASPSPTPGPSASAVHNWKLKYGVRP